MTIDYKIDGEVHEVVFKSSDGKLFSILKEKALQSEVWKNMLQVGDNQTEEGGIDETKAVKLDEKSDEVLVFLETLDQSKWKQMFYLSASSIAVQLKMADKYQAVNAALYVPCMIIIPDEQWSLEEVLLVYHRSALFNIHLQVITSLLTKTRKAERTR